MAPLRLLAIEPPTAPPANAPNAPDKRPDDPDGDTFGVNELLARHAGGKMSMANPAVAHASNTAAEMMRQRRMVPAAHVASDASGAAGAPASAGRRGRAVALTAGW
jgi:hypothetical protein